MKIRILLVLLTVVSTAEIVFRRREYTALTTGEKISGKVTEISTVNPMDCIRRCLSDDLCVACATTHDKRYVIIQRRGKAQEKQTLVSAAGAAIFTAYYAWNYTEVIGDPLGSWNGPPAALYFDFDTLTGLELKTGSGASNYEALIPGKVNQAVVTDSSLNQWVDLGVLCEACITRPDTCGPEGAAVAVWVKIYECNPYWDGFLSSYEEEKTGFMFLCITNSIRNYVALENRNFLADVPQTMNLWIHLVLNFLGQNSGEGTQAFTDGVLVSRDQSGYSTSQTAGDGRVVVGKRYVNVNNYYAHVEMDELIFFNQALLEDQVKGLYDAYQ